MNTWEYGYIFFDRNEGTCFFINPEGEKQDFDNWHVALNRLGLEGWECYQVEIQKESVSNRFFHMKRCTSHLHLA